MSAYAKWSSRLTRRTVLAGAGMWIVGSAAGFATGSTMGRPNGSSAVRVWRHYSNCRYGQIHLRTSEPAAGVVDGATPLVCLHESPTSGHEFARFQSVMSLDRRVICPDTPGYGGSDGPFNQPEIDEYAHALAEALTGLGYGAGGAGAVDVLGFHTGTIVACALANQRPDLVRRLVMPGTPYFPARVREEQRLRYGEPRPFNDTEYVGSSYRKIVLQVDEAGDPLAAQRDSVLPVALRHQNFATRLRAGTRSHFGFEAVFRYDLDRALSALTQPALFPVLNEWLDEPTRRAAALVLGSELVERPDLTKYVWELEPAKMSGLVRPFLDRPLPRSVTPPYPAAYRGGHAENGNLHGDFKRGGARRWREYAANRYGQMHVRSLRPASTNKPAVVLFHPSPASGAIFNELAEFLGVDRTVHALDTPGFGDSDGPRAQPTIEDLAGAMAESLIGLGHGPKAGGPVDLLGVETGAFIAAEVARQTPDLVRRIVLCRVPYFPVHKRSNAEWRLLRSYDFFTDRNYVDRLYKQLVVHGDPKLSFRRRLENFTDYMLAGPNGEWGLRAVFSYDADKALRSIARPALLMAFDDELTESTRAAESLLPNAEYLHLQGLSNLGFMSHPEKVTHAVREYLDRVFS